MKTKFFAAAALVAGVATTGATAKPRVMKPVMASIVCMNMSKANATVTMADKKTVHYTVNAGGNPNEIELEFPNVERVYLDLNGRLVLLTKEGDFRALNATYYQMVDGKRKLISGNFRAIGVNHAAFHVGKYNPELPLEIETIIQGNLDFRG